MEECRKLEAVPEEEIANEAQGLFAEVDRPLRGAEAHKKQAKEWEETAAKIRNADRLEGGQKYPCGECEKLLHHLSLAPSWRAKHTTERDGRKYPTYLCAPCELGYRKWEGDETCTLEDVEVDVRT